MQGKKVSTAIDKLKDKGFDHYKVETKSGKAIDEKNYSKYVISSITPTGETKTSETITLTVKKSAAQIAKEKAEKEQKELEGNPEAYKAACQTVTYEDLYRNPDSYKNSNINMRGKIMQVYKENKTTFYLVQVTQGDYGIWDDIVIVADMREEKESNFIEDDIIQFYGIARGNTSYNTALGSQKNVPLIKGLYIDLSN